MADYYPLIARAVAGLDKNSGDARRALYERARTALVAQLRSVTPALSENDVTRERLALEESIRKVEAEAARKSWIDPAHGKAASRIKAPEFPRWDPPAANGDDSHETPGPLAARPEPAAGRPAAPAPRPVGNGHAGGHAQPSLRSQRYVDPVFDQPLPPDAMPRAPAVHARAPGGNGQRRTLMDAGLNDFRNVVSETDDPVEVQARGKPARDPYPVIPSQAPDHYADAPMLEPHPPLSDYPAPPMLEAGHDYEEPRLVPARPRPMVHPERELRSASSLKDKIRLAVLLLLLAGMGGVVAWQWSNMTMLFGAFRSSPPAEVSREVAGPATQKGSAKIPDRFDPGAPASTAAPTLATTPSPALGGAAVAQKVVLYEEDPADPQGKRYVGSAIWRTERVAAGAGQPPEIAIRADVEIPERKLAMTWSLRRNTDQSLPASHTVEIMFRLPQDFSAGGISNVPGILMKASEQTRGVPLAGLAVKVTNGFFLIGLSAVDADRERNIKMLKDRQWFDIPVVYDNNRRAILALEKGTPGERAFAEAFTVWRQ
jgi:hypothetical protein